jgi:REP element-mobilizing transposase RayT
MSDPPGPAHTKWECRYHIVWISKCRMKRLFEPGGMCKKSGLVPRELARHEKSGIVEGRFLIDHVHKLVAIPPNYATDLIAAQLNLIISLYHGLSRYGPARGARQSFAGLACKRSWNTIGPDLFPALGRRPRCDWMTWTLVGGS